MKAASLAALVALVTVAPTARGQDTVRACIAASTNAQTLRKQGKLLDAREELIACARDACPPIVRSHCARWLSEVEAAIPSIVVRAEDANGADAIGARVSIDGHPGRLDGQPVRLDPGQHTVAIESDRGERRAERLLLVEGEASRRVTLRFAPVAGATSTSTPSPPPAPSPPKETEHYVPVGAWVLGGVGVFGLGVATYFAIAASNDLNGLNATCSPHCSDAETQPGRTDALLFDVFLGAGAVAVAGALVWGLAFPSHAAPRASTARIEVLPLAGGAMTSLRLSY